MPSRPRPDRPEDAFFRLLERIDRLETMVYGRSSSVTNGRTRFVGNESLLVQGSQKVEGWLVVTGTERVTGLLEVLGRLVVAGALDLTGSLNVDGGSITAGNVRIENGKIYAGGMVIDPDDNGGSVTFPGGAKVTANDGTPGVKVESGAGWAAYIAQNGIRFAGAIGEASFTMTPDTLAIGADTVRISADELRLSAPTAAADEVTHILGRTSSGEARWIPAP